MLSNFSHSNARQFASFVVYDDKNRPMETFGGPCRLAKWDSLPDGWCIEEFWGDVSRGMITLEQVREIAAKHSVS